MRAELGMRSSTSGGAGLRAHGATRAISPRVKLVELGMRSTTGGVSLRVSAGLRMHGATRAISPRIGVGALCTP